jgi:hypothetical protein
LTQALHFSGRDLPTHAEYVSASELVEGRVYFAVHFLDEEMLIPELRPIVYLGRGLSGGDVENLYFQDADSYTQGARWATPVDGVHTEFHSVDLHTPAVYEFERALDTLLACSLRRGSRP